MLRRGRGMCSMTKRLKTRRKKIILFPPLGQHPPGTMIVTPSLSNLPPSVSLSPSFPSDPHYLTIFYTISYCPKDYGQGPRVRHGISREDVATVL